MPAARIAKIRWGKEFNIAMNQSPTTENHWLGMVFRPRCCSSITLQLLLPWTSFCRNEGPFAGRHEHWVIESAQDEQKTPGSPNCRWTSANDRWADRSRL